MRIFIASFLTAESARRLAAEVPVIDGVRPVSEENLHMTLQFIGAVPEAASADICALVADLDGAPLSAQVEEITGFPSSTRATTLVALLGVSEQVFEWHRALQAGWPVAEGPRTFAPHVTLGRCRRGICLPDGKNGLSGMTVELQAPAAYRSETLPEGARYTRLD